MSPEPPDDWKPSPAWRASEVKQDGTPSQHYRRGTFAATLQDIRFGGVAMSVGAVGIPSLGRDVYGPDSWRVAMYQAETLVNMLAAGDAAGGAA